MRKIATILNLSPRTIESYFVNIKNKLNINKLIEIVAVTLAENLCTIKICIIKTSFFGK